MKSKHSSKKQYLETISNIKILNQLPRDFAERSVQHNLQQFVNRCMIRGKKNKSDLIFTNTLCKLAQHGKSIPFLLKAIENIKPILEVKKIRISGSTQFIPCSIPSHRQNTLAVRWMMEAAIRRMRKPNISGGSQKIFKQNTNLEQCILDEIIDAYNKVGSVCKKRDELHKLAESNRGFAHYRWW